MTRWNRKKTITVSIAVLLCLSAGTYGVLEWKPTKSSAAEQQTIDTVKKGSIRVSVSGTSQFEAKDVQSITAPSDGTVKTMNLSRSVAVKKGDLLFEETNPDLTTALDDAQVSLSQLQSDLNDLQTQQAHLSIVASVTGKLTLPGNMSVGSNVNKSGQVGTIADTSTFSVKLPFLVEDAVQMHPGEAIEVNVDGYMLSKMGTIQSVGSDPRPDANGNKMFDVTIKLDNDGSLTSGLQVSATASIGSRKVVSKEKGQLDYVRVDSLLSGASGQIKKLNAKNGDIVHQGDVIATISNDTLADQIQQKQASIERQKLTVADAQQKVDSLKVTAPFDGVFSTDFANQKTNVLNNYPVGAKVTAGTAFGSVASMNTMQLPIQVDELDLPNIKSGMKAQIKVDSISGKSFQGTVGQVSTVGTTTNGVTNYQVVLLVDNSDPKNQIQYGMTATAEILIQDKSDIIVLPLDDLQQAQGKRYVKLKRADGTIEDQHEVQIGIRSKTDVEITGGLQEGDQVIAPTRQKTTLSTTDQQRLRQQFQQGGFGGAGGFQGGGGGFTGGGAGGSGGAGGAGGAGGGGNSGRTGGGGGGSRGGGGG